MITVGFAGLPSAGKSTMVNALAGKRVLESGVCRTTTEVCIIGASNAVLGPNGPKAVKWVETKLVSDDGVEFRAVDLPGICDAEDTSGAFDSVTHEWAAKCDVVVWVTDARTALMTKHEVAELTRLMAAIQERADEDGTLYQFMIVLAKYDEPEPFASATTGVPIEYIPGEIRTETEHSTIEGHIERVERAFPGTRVVKFNAFARIETTACSAALKALVSASSPRRHEKSNSPNAAFDLAWATENITEKRLVQMSRVLRATRVRAVAAEKEIVELRGLAGPKPVYDERVVFDFATAISDRSGTRQGAALPSVSAKLDRMCSAWKSFVKAGDYWARCEQQAVLINLAGKSAHCNYSQVIAPIVRPVYGDVYIVPRSLVFGGSNCPAYYGESESIGIHIGREMGDAYVLKVGEADHGDLNVLLAKDELKPIFLMVGLSIP